MNKEVKICNKLEATHGTCQREHSTLVISQSVDDLDKVSVKPVTLLYAA